MRCYDCAHEWASVAVAAFETCPRCIASIERFGVPGMVPMSQLMRTTFPDLAWHIPALFPEGFSLLVGAPKAGKSWLALAIAIAAGGGGELFGETIATRPVLYLALEDSLRRLKSRAVALGTSLDSAPLLDVLTKIPPGMSATDVIRSWRESLPDDSEPPLVIVDTLGRVRGTRRPTDTPYDHDYRVGVAVKEAADAVDGGALIAVHHDRKAESADFVDDVSGTNGLAGSADTIVVLRRERESTDGVVLVTGRDVDEASYGISFDAGRWSRIGGTWDEAREAAAAVRAGQGRGGNSQTIIDYLASNDGASPAEIADGTGLGSSIVRQALQRMVTGGVVIRPTRGRYGPPVVTGSHLDPHHNRHFVTAGM